MFEQLMTKINQWLGKEAATPMQQQQRVQQVYHGGEVDIPEFAEHADRSEWAELSQANAVCTFVPRVEYQKLFQTGRHQADGNLAVEYEGIAASCGAIKKFAAEVAKEEGLAGAYRYVDINHIFECCCGNPDYCPFYRKAIAEKERIERSMRKLPNQG